MASDDNPSWHDLQLPVYVDRRPAGLANRAWTKICGSVGFQSGLLIVGSMVTETTGVYRRATDREWALAIPIVLVCTAVGVAVGHLFDKPGRRRGSPSGLRYLFVLLFQFALMFAWLKAWGNNVIF